MSEGAHKEKKQRTEMTDEHRYLSEGNDTADEVAEQGAEKDGAEIAECVAKEKIQGYNAN